MIPYCDACTAALKQPEPSGGYRICQRCWDLCVETQFHPFGCSSEDCQAQARETLWALLARHGEAGGESQIAGAPKL